MSWHPQGQYRTVGDRQTHWVDVGEGPPVLLLHGFLHSSWTWRETIAPLAKHHRVIAPDLPGFGWGDRDGGDASIESFSDWLLGLLDALGVRRIHAGVGNSLGGAVLLDIALRQPARFEHLVLVSPLAAPLRLPALPLRLLGLRPFAPLFRATAGNPLFIRRALAWTAYKRIPVDDEILQGFAPLRRAGSHRAAVAAAKRLWTGTVALARQLHRLRAPTTLVWGENDRVLSARYGKRVAALMPEADLLWFADCGHCPQEEDPERFNALVLERLGSDRVLRPEDVRSPTPAGDPTPEGPLEA